MRLKTSPKTRTWRLELRFKAPKRWRMREDERTAERVRGKRGERKEKEREEGVRSEGKEAQEG